MRMILGSQRSEKELLVYSFRDNVAHFYGYVMYSEFYSTGYDNI
jgi:hypothetical protein